MMKVKHSNTNKTMVKDTVCEKKDSEQSYFYILVKILIHLNNSLVSSSAVL